MPEGIRPRVNDARQFLEITKNFKDPRELIREALSNSWDANATKVAIRFATAAQPGTRKRRITVEIQDDGDGMDNKFRERVGSSEIEGFFNLGDSGKPKGSIGSKGHGTKIFYKGQGLNIKSWKDGARIDACTEVPPWDTLQSGSVPTYRYDLSPDTSGRGTEIHIDGFQAKQSEFSSIDALSNYIRWFTVCGSFGQYFGQSKKMDVWIQPIDSGEVIIPFGFHFPPESTDLSKGTERFCKVFGPKTLDCGITEEGVRVRLEIVGAVLGDGQRSFIPDTFTHTGIWLGKDFLKVERKNELIERVFGGQYYYRSMVIFANCQQFDLTADRNSIRTDQEEYELALERVKSFLEEVRDDATTNAYFEATKKEREHKDEQQDEKKRVERWAVIDKQRKDRLNRYKGRPALKAAGVTGAPTKEPESEAETALLLQAMISSKHPGIDFVIGDYSTASGVDLLVEKTDKAIRTERWAELVSSLEKLFAWEHAPQGIHIVVCYTLGKVNEVQSFTDGTEARLVNKVRGRYALIVGSEAIDVYVLREILEAGRAL